jgi:hypothetical protein
MQAKLAIKKKIEQDKAERAAAAKAHQQATLTTTQTSQAIGAAPTTSKREYNESSIQVTT